MVAYSAFICGYKNMAVVPEKPKFIITCTGWRLNTLRARRNRRHFADDIFKDIFLNENVWISIEISLKFVPKGPVDNIPSLVQIMAWRHHGDKPLSEAMMVRLLTHICANRPQWVNRYAHKICGSRAAFWKNNPPGAICPQSSWRPM